MCLFLQGFYCYKNFKKCKFSTIEEIIEFLKFRSGSIVNEILNVRGKVENTAKSAHQFDWEMINILKNEIFGAQAFKRSIDEIESPRIQNLIYKPILSFVYYTLWYMQLKKEYDKIKR